LRLIGITFVLLAIYLTVQSISVLVVGHNPEHGSLAIAWTSVTAG